MTDNEILALEAEIFAREETPHLDGNYRTGIYEGLRLAWRIVQGIPDTDYPGVDADDPGPYTAKYPTARISPDS